MAACYDYYMAIKKQAHVTPKDFFLWAGAMVALFWSVIAFISLMFSYIDYVLPNATNGYAGSDPYQGPISFFMASLLVTVPLFLLIMHLIRRDIKNDAARAELWVRRWALILTLFLAGLAMTIDVVVLLQHFFSGQELTAAFLLKVVIVLMVAAFSFMHFIADYWGYWNEKKNLYKVQMVGGAVALLVFLCVAAGFIIIGTPQHARMVRQDNQKISDLGNIQWQIVSYWQSKHTLPASLSNLNDPISQQVIPTDAQTGNAYEYTATSDLSFQLCAEFNAPTDPRLSNDTGTTAPIAMPFRTTSTMNQWIHTAGHTCFTRTIDSQLYPPVDNMKAPAPAVDTAKVPTKVAPAN